MGPTTELARRQILARRIADTLSAHAQVSATVVFGSVALGQVDTFSDIDMLVICAEVPTVSEREGLTTSLGLSFVNTASDTPPFCAQDSCVSSDGLVLTLHYQRSAWITAVISEVLGGAITTKRLPFRPYTLLGLLQRGLLLSDKHATVAAWREQMHPYPKHLKRNLICSFAPTLRESAEELVITATRDLGPRNIIFHLNWGVDALVGILLALNEQYDTAERRFEKAVLPRLKRKPEGLEIRLHDILIGPFDTEGARHRAEAFKKLAGNPGTVTGVALARNHPSLT